MIHVFLSVHAHPFLATLLVSLGVSLGAAPTSSAPSAPAATLVRSADALPGATSPVRASAVSGRVLDAHGRRPVPDYLVEITDGQTIERVTTDAEGRFRGSIEFAHGKLVLRAVDAESVVTVPEMGGLALPDAGNPPLERAFDGNPLEIEWHVGPTFELRFAAAQPEGAPLEAAISAAWLQATSPGAIDEGVALRAAVRSDGASRRWVRFGPLPAGTFGAPFGARLVVVHGDGLWRAEADVSQLLDARGGTVELTWQACSRWIGLLRGAGGRPLAGTWVVATRTDEHQTVRERRRTRTDDRGRYNFLGLVPGTWRLEGDPLRYNRFQTEPRVLVGGTPSQLNLSLDAVSDPVSLLVHVRGAPAPEGATPPAPIELVLRRAGETLPQETLRAEWTIEEGRFAVRATFPGVPSGAYQVQLVPPAGDEDAWPVRSVAGRTAPEPLVFERR